MQQVAVRCHCQSKTIHGTVAWRAGTLQACSAYLGRVYVQSVQSVIVPYNIMLIMQIGLMTFSHILIKQKNEKLSQLIISFPPNSGRIKSITKIMILKILNCLFLVSIQLYIVPCKVIMQGKLFQRCTHLLYCSVLSLGGNVNMDVTA